MSDSKILIWTQSYDNKGPHFIRIIQVIFKGFNYLDSNIFKPCNIDELGTNATNGSLQRHDIKTPSKFQLPMNSQINGVHT
jgi:hypothetical protein